jgi:hypothetical protein
MVAHGDAVKRLAILSCLHSVVVSDLDLEIDRANRNSSPVTFYLLLVASGFLLEMSYGTDRQDNLRTKASDYS